jgi:CheY-like chemotaxis protein
MSRMLKRMGNEISMAENGKIALDMITGGTNRYDVIFLDK